VADYMPETVHPRMGSPISVLAGLGHGRP